MSSDISSADKKKVYSLIIPDLKHASNKKHERLSVNLIPWNDLDSTLAVIFVVMVIFFMGFEVTHAKETIVDKK